MKLYKVEKPIPCNTEGCNGMNAVLIMLTDEGIYSAVCPTCVQSMSSMNSDNAEFFAQVPSQLITMKCMDCDKEFEQLPHPLTGQAFYYSCPKCRKMRHEEAKKKPAEW